jgi:acetyl-CoA carboxylase biotin carboxyl carrier protein
VAKEDKKTEERGSTGDEPAGRSASGGPASAGGEPALADLDFVKGLIEAVDSSGIDSLEITRAGTRVKISKTPPAGGGAAYYSLPAGFGTGNPGGAGGGPAPSSNAGSSPQPASVGPGGGGAAATESTEPSPAAPAADSGLIDVKSPMVGTFYRAPAPEAPPYVEVGTRVGKGQTLCIIEAMKLMNELESEADGVIKQVLVENAEPVEYGQVLFRIDPSG